MQSGVQALVQKGRQKDYLGLSIHLVGVNCVIIQLALRYLFAVIRKGSKVKTLEPSNLSTYNGCKSNTLISKDSTGTLISLCNG